MKYYVVYDSTGNIVRSFDTWQLAHNFCIICGRLDWTIRQLVINNNK